MNVTGKSSLRSRWMWGTLALVCAVIVGAIALSTVLIAPLSFSKEQRTTAGVGDLVATSRACQTFVAYYDGLAQVQVMLDDYGRESDGSFHFYLRPAPDASETLVAITHDASEVENDVYHIFEFPPIKDSAGRSFAFCLEAPNAAQKSSITAIGTFKDWYPEGEVILHEMWGGGADIQDLDFRLRYRPPVGKKLVILLERMATSKPFLYGAQWFYAILGIAYLALLGVLFLRFLPLHQDPKP